MDKMFDLDLQLSSSQGDTTPNTIFISNRCITNEGCPATPGCLSQNCVSPGCGGSAQCSGDPCVMPYGDDI